MTAWSKSAPPTSKLMTSVTKCSKHGTTFTDELGRAEVEDTSTGTGGADTGTGRVAPPSASSVGEEEKSSAVHRAGI